MTSPRPSDSSKDMVTVTHFCRRSFPGAFSVETLFDAIRNTLKRQGVNVSYKVAPCFSKGLTKRLFNIMWAWRNSDVVNHVTGDIHYVVMGLPRHSTILTIHDLEMLDRLKGLPRWIVKLFWFDLPTRHAALVTVISQATKDDLIRRIAVDEEKVVVIPNTIHDRFQPVPRVFAADKPTILHIGTKQNKNLERLIEALKGISCHLTIVGKLTLGQKRLLEEFEIEHINRWHLTDEEIHKCYLDCDVLCFASLQEGFGVPIIEAQSVGRVVVTSDCSSMPEVAGVGACLVNPLDVQSIRSGVLRVTGDEKYRSELIQHGFENSKRFDPNVIAQQYISAYQRVAATTINRG